jgi:hypothetical protein
MGAKSKAPRHSLEIGLPQEGSARTDLPDVALGLRGPRLWAGWEPARGGQHQGSQLNRRRPAGFKVRASKVWISVIPPTSSVTTSRSPATAVAVIFAPFGSTAVISVTPTALPSSWKRR